MTYSTGAATLSDDDCGTCVISLSRRTGATARDAHDHGIARDIETPMEAIRDESRTALLR
jgi:hypothetical protein